MKNKSAENFFTASEKEKISDLVKKAERETSGEIAIMVVNDSDSYREAGILGALLLSAFIALIIAVTIQHVTIWTFIPVVLVVWFPSLSFLRRMPRLKLSLVGKKRLEEAVQERAVRAFFEKGLYRTRNETGILVFISILEHKVWVLGDRGINMRIDQQVWSAIAGELAGKIKAGQAFSGLCTVIEKLGVVLSENFPKPVDDANELPDEVIIEKQARTSPAKNI